jgi:protein required for attachment to host cells
MPRTVRTWVVTADGSRARIYESLGPGTELREVLHEDESALRTKEIVSDKGGRRRDTTGSGRHAVSASSDPQRHHEREFARRICGFLDRQANEGAFDRLVLTAAPATLGDMRALLHKATREFIHFEVDKDFTSLAPRDIVDRLADTVRL